MDKKQVTDLRSELLDSRFGAKSISTIAESKRFPLHEMRDDVAFQIINDELYLDGNARQNLATFCQTWDDENVHKLMDLSINKNWIDKEEYPQSAAIDLRCVNMVADLWHAPAPKNGQAVGTNSIRSPDASTHRRPRAPRHPRPPRAPPPAPLIPTAPASACLPARLRPCARHPLPARPPPSASACLAPPRPRAVSARICRRGRARGRARVCARGRRDRDARVLDPAAADVGAGTHLSVCMAHGTAGGGLLPPFVAPDIVWDFRLPRVKSISASGHKFGLAPLGCGWVIWRDEEALPQELVFNVDYLGGQIGTFAINFSRPAGQVIAQYYEFLRLGREGYTKVQNASYQVAAYLADEIAKLGPYEFICTGRPDEGIPAVCFKLKDGEDPGYTLYDLSERLRLRGWQVPAFTLGGEATDIVVMRIMCRRGFEMDFAELLLEDYKASLKYLSDHPKLQGIAQQNSFKHT
ncbi:pyridoxal-dependent decarboxylase [Escherichia coli]|uniref:pyridoxal-dependent decarboxylase n=2 Tax=Escherichia coli TaxID=562 RepID=UPI0031F53339